MIKQKQVMLVNKRKSEDGEADAAAAREGPGDILASR